MALSESLYGVWLHDRRVGTIHQRGDYTRFTLNEEYRTDPERPVLGLVFEQNLLQAHAAALRLPRWFSNLLPEGALRDWIAADRRVSPDREMELLGQVGHDLPGAVRVLPADEHPSGPLWDASVVGHENSRSSPTEDEPTGWRFSLAGVSLKFSMLAAGDRLTLPAFGEGGDWIVKLPDRVYPDVPRNEYSMMSLAAAAGIEVPEVRLVHRDQFDGLPENVWPSGEDWAYAVRRFDRDDDRRLVHIEDLAQVRNVYPAAKYEGNYETVASLTYRRRDLSALREFARRLGFMVLVSSGDGHLKNWSLIYRNPRIPTLSPAYDLVATAFYRSRHDGPERLALKLGGSRRFEAVTLESFERLERRLGATGAELAGSVTDLVKGVHAAWPEHAESLRQNPALLASIDESIKARSRDLLRLKG